MQICRGQRPLEVGLLDNSQYLQLLHVLQSLVLASDYNVVTAEKQQVSVHSMWYRDEQLYTQRSVTT
jgi:hypothetical protein